MRKERTVNQRDAAFLRQLERYLKKRGLLDG